MSDEELRVLALDFTATHPQEASRVLAQLSAQEAADFFESCPVQTAADTARFMTAQELAPTLASLSPAQAAEMLSCMPRDQAASTLRRMGAAERSAIIDRFPTRLKASTTALMRFAEDSAGALMEPAVVTVLAGITAGVALEEVHLHLEQLRYYVYVVDDNERLVGVVSLRQLMTSDPNRLVDEIMSREVHRISARAVGDAILRHHGWKTVHSLPVVDERSLLVGILRHETVQRLSGGESRGSESLNPAAALGDLFWAGSQRVLAELFDIMKRGPK